MKNLVGLVVAVVSLSLTPVALAHGGRTDSDGCHVDSRTGERHCHGAPRGNGARRRRPRGDETERDQRQRSGQDAQ